MLHLCYHEKNYNSIFYFSLCKCIFTKKHPFVSLLTEVKGKRTTFYVENKGKISYDVFLMIQTKDYQRNNNKPVIKCIPAGKKIKLTTILNSMTKKETIHPFLLSMKNMEY